MWKKPGNIKLSVKDRSLV